MYINVLINLNRVYKCTYFCWCLSFFVNGIYLDSVDFVKENCYLIIGKYVFWCFNIFKIIFLLKFINFEIVYMILNYNDLII